MAIYSYTTSYPFSDVWSLPPGHPWWWDWLSGWRWPWFYGPVVLGDIFGGGTPYVEEPPPPDETPTPAPEEAQPEEVPPEEGGGGTSEGGGRTPRYRVDVTGRSPRELPPEIGAAAAAAGIPVTLVLKPGGRVIWELPEEQANPSRPVYRAEGRGQTPTEPPPEVPPVMPVPPMPVTTPPVTVTATPTPVDYVTVPQNPSDDRGPAVWLDVFRPPWMPPPPLPPVNPPPHVVVATPPVTVTDTPSPVETITSPMTSTITTPEEPPIVIPPVNPPVGGGGGVGIPPIPGVGEASGSMGGGTIAPSGPVGTNAQLQSLLNTYYRAGRLPTLAELLGFTPMGGMQ